MGESLHCCDLSLGPDPWERLAQERVEGALSWNGAEAAPAWVQIRGAHTRRFPKRSLQVTLRSGYGLPSPPPLQHKVRRIHLNADWVDPTLMRSKLSFDLHASAGVPAPLASHVTLTINGEGAGTYVALESVDRDFCRRRGWERGHIFYAINRGANFGLVSPFSKSLKDPLSMGYQAIQKADRTRVEQLLLEINLTDPEEFPDVATQWVDVPGYLRWLMIAVFVGNRDGFVHNYALYQAESGGPFRIIPWDYDATWGINIHGEPARLDRVPVTGWNKLTHRLLAVNQFREEYRQLFLHALDTLLHPEAIADRVDRMAAAIGSVVEHDQTRRDLPFWSEVERLKQWGAQRADLLRQELEKM